MAKKITKATIKSFVNKNRGELYVRTRSDFNGMSDMVETVDGGFIKAEETTVAPDATLGVQGVWLVGGSRNSFSAYEDETYVGFNVYNCCGEFDVVIKK